MAVDSKDSDDPSFADTMAQMGVRPLQQDRAQSAKRRKGTRSDTRAQAQQTQQTQQAAQAAQAAETAQAAQAAQAAKTAQAAQAAQTTIDNLRQELAQLTSAHATLEREHARRREAHARLEQQWQDERARLEQQWQDERARLEQRWQDERDRLATRDRELARKLDSAENTLARHRSLGEVLTARGCADHNEAITVLQRLLDVRPRDVLESIDMISTEAFARVLDQRVAFVAQGVEFDAGPDCVVMRVAPERCEITGGSDIRAAFQRLLDVCAKETVKRITIVGGSPAYRRQLRRLRERHGEGLELNLVSGTQRRTRKRAEADMRSSDRVVIWGATELNHSVSAVYTGAPEKIIRVVHRGISRMLVHVADDLARSRR